VQVTGAACGVDFHVKYLAGNHAPLSSAGDACILNSVLQVEKHARLVAGVIFIHKDGSTAQQIAVTLQHEIERRIKQWMPRTHESGERLSLRLDETFLKDNALIPREHRLTKTDETIPIPNRRGNMRDLVTASLAQPCRAAEQTEGFEEEGLDVVRLKPTGIGTLHVLADAIHPAGIHGIMSEGSLFQHVLNAGLIEGIRDDIGETGANIGHLAVADGLDEEFTQRAALKLNFPQHIEDLSSKVR
jgi:hypothetical protein